jgi:hypothetical protein
MSVPPESVRRGKHAHWRSRLRWAAVAATLSLVFFATFSFYDYLNAPPGTAGLPTSFFGTFRLFESKNAPVNTAGTPMTMDGLLGAYMDNPTQADQLYASKTYYVTGVPISLQQNPSTGQYYSDFVLNGLIQFYWKDISQASKVVPCTQDVCSPILAECFLVGFAVESGGTQVIMFNNCEFIHS